MKKILFIASTLILMSFMFEKKATIKFSEGEINYHWQNIDNIKTIVDQSSLPHNQVSYIIKSLDSLQNNIRKNIKIESDEIEKKK